jgi:hypothetical protein
VFHFDASAFGNVIATGNLAAPFVNCVGRKNGDIHYAYADLATAAILVGSGFAEPKFSKTLETAMRSIRMGIPVKVNAHSGGKPNGIPVMVNSSRSAATLTC